MGCEDPGGAPQPGSVPVDRSSILTEGSHDVMTTRSSQRRPLRRSTLVVFAAELFTLGLVGGFAAVLLAANTDLTDPTQPIEVLGFAAAIAATILLGVASWLSGNAGAMRITLAVGCFAVAYLSFRAVEIEAPLVRDVALIAVVAILASTLHSTDALLRGRRAVLALAGVLTVAAAVLLLVPSAVLGAPVEYILGMGTAAVAGTVSAGLVLAGLRRAKPLLRRVGLAFGLVTAGQVAVLVADAARTTAVLEFAAVGALLLAAAHFALEAVTAVWRENEESQTMLVEAAVQTEALRARDHEMRNLVLGLSGAANALTSSGSAVTDTGRLRAVTRSEIARLQRMLGASAGAAEAATVHVGPLLHDLATLHRAAGHEVEVDAADGLHAGMAAGALSQVVTNCLLNCARHAPGARVVLRADESGGRVVVEVADDGPGLPAGSGPELLERGRRGPGSNGQGLGLHISVDLVRRSSGTLRLASPGRGCVVVIELPVAAAVPGDRAGV